MAIVGPGAELTQQHNMDVKPTLEGASEFEYVTIQNPLSDDFAIKVAQSRPVNMPFEIRQDTSGNTSAATRTEADARQIYGISLKNNDHPSKKHIINTTVIKAGQTINLKGDEAQVAVRQLVNEIIQREGKSNFMADPHVRQQVEERIIVHRGSVQDLMDSVARSPQQLATEAINRSNEVINEQLRNREEISGEGEAGTTSAGVADTAPKKRGRKPRLEA